MSLSLDFSMNSSNSCAEPSFLFCCFAREVIAVWKNSATASLVCNSCLIRDSLSDFSTNVLGSRFGNSFNITGSNSSMNGMSAMTRNGTNRNKSVVVLINCNLSLLVMPCPCTTLFNIPEVIFTSATNNFEPSYIYIMI